MEGPWIKDIWGSNWKKLQNNFFLPEVLGAGGKNSKFHLLLPLPPMSNHYLKHNSESWMQKMGEVLILVVDQIFN